MTDIEKDKLMQEIMGQTEYDPADHPQDDEGYVIEDGQAKHIWRVFDAEARLFNISHKEPQTPFAKFVGNEKALNRLERLAFEAWSEPDHACRHNIAFFGPSSTGKTTLARLFAKTLEIPFAEINPKSINDLEDVLMQIVKAFENLSFYDMKTADENGEGGQVISLEIEPQLNPKGQQKNYIKVPPCVIFLDEVHALPNKIVQGLLKAIEPNDRVLDTGTWIADCSNVCWIIATTDRGLLFDAFDNRFIHINLELYSKEEMAEIVHRANPDWAMEVCRLVAKYNACVPREALAFAKEMRIEKNMNSEASWEDAAKIVADDAGIDEHGMTFRRVSILRALAKNGAIPKSALSAIADCKEEELEKYIMPPLLSCKNEGQMVKTTSKGYVITEVGKKELAKRDNDRNND